MNRKTEFRKMRRYLFIIAAFAALLFLTDSGADGLRVSGGGRCGVPAGLICDADMDGFVAERRFGSDFTEPVQPNIAGAEHAAAPHATCGLRAAASAAYALDGSWRTASAGRFCGLFIVPRRTADYYVLRLRRLII